MTAALPSFSIIIPTYERPDRLAACLEAIACLDYPRDRFEVIVVDDGSETSPQEVVDSVRDRLEARLLRQPNGGPASARNRGAAQARGAFLAFTDDDCLPAPDWLSELASRFEKTPDHAIGGRTFNGLDKNPFSTFSQMIIDFAYRRYNANPAQATFFASNNLAVPAQAFATLGGFDQTFLTSEDREFCDRWLHHSRQLSYVPGAVVCHTNDLTLDSFCRQHFNYGRGAFHFYKARAGRGSGGFAPDAGFYGNLLRWSWQRFRSEPHVMGTLRQGSLLALWLLVNTLGFAWQAVAEVGLPRKSGETGSQGNE